MLFCFPLLGGRFNVVYLWGKIFKIRSKIPFSEKQPDSPSMRKALKDKLMTFNKDLNRRLITVMAMPIFNPSTREA